MDVQYKSIGKRIKLRRKELNIKQNELAEKLNISNNHLSSVENGREKPSLELLLNICELLNVTPDLSLIHIYNFCPPFPRMVSYPSFI